MPRCCELLLLLDGRPAAAAPWPSGRALGPQVAGPRRRRPGRRRRRPRRAERACSTPFLEMMAAERGAARHTLDAYRRDLADFARLPRAARPRAAAAAAGDDIRAYLAALAGAGLRPRPPPGGSPRSASISASSSSRAAAPTTRPPQIDTPKPGPPPAASCWSEEEIEALIAAARAKEGPDSLRLTALLELFYATGLRVSELVGLPLVGAGARPRPCCTVRGKGDKERMVPIGGAAREALAAWLAVRPFYRDRPLARDAGCSPRAAAAAISPASASPSCSRRWHPRPGSTPPGSRRMCCAMPSPAISSPTGRICARCRRCLVTPTSPPRRSIPTSRPSGWRGGARSIHPLARGTDPQADKGDTA